MFPQDFIINYDEFYGFSYTLKLMLSIQNTYNPLYKDLPFLPKKINEQKNQTNFYF